MGVPPSRPFVCRDRERCVRSSRNVLSVQSRRVVLREVGRRLGQEPVRGQNVRIAGDAVARDYGIALWAGSTRRNIVTRGISLNHLVGVEFTVGSVHLRGVKLCEPCGHLEQVSGQPIRKPLVHRGGLNCEVLETGRIEVGAPIHVGDHVELTLG